MNGPARETGGADAADGDALAALVARLRADGAGGSGYESLRRRLIRYFRLHDPARAEELADVVFERLARKIHAGTEIASVPSYALGVARMVLRETRAQDARRRVAEADPTFPAEIDPDETAQREAVAAALGTCLDEAGAASRRLILAYYAADGAERIAIRQRLADAAAISLNALRNRALRLRAALEDCVRRRLGGGAA